jgi:protoheme IX farnesyltransferase
MSSPAVAAARTSAPDYLELTKPRITLMVCVTAFVGFATASPGPLAVSGLLAALLGTGLVAAGASVLNMLLERDVDARMRRTRDRPLPAGRLRPAEALAFGLALTATGLLELALLSGAAAALVASVTWASYVLVYTPLKRRTSLATLVGAVPGALPPVIGWAAARGTIEPGAVVLFTILFLWQVPHFLAIAWIYRDDYAQGGLPMLPVLDASGRLTGRQTVVHSLALFLVSLAPVAAGLAGTAYVAGVLVLDLALTGAAVRFAVQRTLPAARALFFMSLVYLAALSALLVAARP